MNEVNPAKFQAIGMAVGGIFVFCLTLSEILAPCFTFLMGASATNTIRFSPIFEYASPALIGGNIVICVISLILLGVQYMQFKKPFNKKIQILRSGLDVLYSIIAIYCFVISSSSIETDFRYKLVDEWKKNSTSILKYEEIYKCNGLRMFNVTSSEYCDHFINQDISNSYQVTRRMGIPMSLFWFSVVLCRCAAFFLLRFNSM